jgi:beta-glucosidase/6-phospho-beta-glucosidase/beta-galactosidase
MSKKDESKPYRNGGKCKEAPYKTTHVRAPIEIKDQVQEFVKNWHVNKFSHQYAKKINSEIKEKIDEYLFLNNVNWSSPRNSGLKKFMDWLISESD